MLRANWNFYSDIAWPMEQIARIILKNNDLNTPPRYKAVNIEGGNFAEVMIDLVDQSAQMTDDASQFIKDCEDYKGLRGSVIDPEAADLLYKRFRQIIKGTKD